MPVLSYLFSFDGRMPRSRMWLFVPIFVLWSFADERFANATFGAVGFAEFAQNHRGYANQLMLATTPIKSVELALYYALLVLLFISWLAVMAKRIHDRDKSAWWLLLFFALPNAILIVQMNLVISGMSTALPSVTHFHAPPFKALWFASAVVLVWGFVELYCLGGTAGPNRFGEPTDHNST